MRNDRTRPRNDAHQAVSSAAITRTAALAIAVLTTACSGSPPDEVTTTASEGNLRYALRPLTPTGSPFHGVHGLRFDRNGTLYATSVIGQSVFTVDTETAEVTTVIAPPAGMGDDIAFAADGTMVWTAIEDGIVYARTPGQPVRRVLEGYKGVNAVAFDPTGTRLYLSLVFYGDALYEVDLTGASAPRLIADAPGGLNAFDVAEDGTIFGPLAFGGAVVSIDPETGETRTISDDVVSPGALKLESPTSALVVDDGHAVKRVDLTDGTTTLIAEMPAEADNLAIAADGTVYVSLHETNAILRLDVAAGTFDYLIEPSPLNSPAGIAAQNDGSSPLLFAGDMFGGIKILSPDAGAIRHERVELFQPTRIAIDGDSLLAVSQVFGTVARYALDDFRLIEQWDGFSRPGEVLAVGSDLLVADSGSGAVIRVTGPGPDDRRPLLVGLDFPLGLAPGAGGTVFITEAGGGRVLRLDGDGAVTVVAGNFGQPEGIAIDRDGRLLVVDVAARALIAIDPETGVREVLAEDLPIGLSNGPSLFRDVAVSGERLFISSDVDNTVYELVRQ